MSLSPEIETGFLVAHPERLLPDYCWQNWPPVHSDDCRCTMKLKAVAQSSAPPQSRARQGKASARPTEGQPDG